MLKQILGTALLMFTGITAKAAPLPTLNVDPHEVTVSGLSSGGFMAVQLHVAYSATFGKGVGVVAGGPYDCAAGSMANVTGRCMAHSSPIPISELVAKTRQRAGAGLIDPVSNLATSRAYLFSGTLDSIVTPPVVDDLDSYYRSFLPPESIAYEKRIPAEHAFVTDNFGNACTARALPPYINNCGFDLAGAILGHLYGPLKPRKDGDLPGTLVEFDQAGFIKGHGMAASGWIYTPQSCMARKRCRLHVALHGCKQNSASIGLGFVNGTGYNRWADTNDIIVLYPQTSQEAVNGCWDWWGYDSGDYADKAGPQMAAIKAMVDRISSASD